MFLRFYAWRQSGLHASRYLRDTISYRLVSRSVFTFLRLVPAGSLSNDPHLPLKCSPAAISITNLFGDWAFCLVFFTAMFQPHDRSIESGRGHNVCGGFATLKFEYLRGQRASAFVVPSGTK